jgi:hypothetical protein
MRRHFPVEMALKMLLKPLYLPARLQRVVLPPLRVATRLVLG